MVSQVSSNVQVTNYDRSTHEGVQVTYYDYPIQPTNDSMFPFSDNFLNSHTNTGFTYQGSLEQGSNDTNFDLFIDESNTTEAAESSPTFNSHLFSNKMSSNNEVEETTLLSPQSNLESNRSQSGLFKNNRIWKSNANVHITDLNKTKMSQSVDWMIQSNSNTKKDWSISGELIDERLIPISSGVDILLKELRNVKLSNDHSLKLYRMIVYNNNFHSYFTRKKYLFAYIQTNILGKRRRNRQSTGNFVFGLKAVDKIALHLQAKFRNNVVEVNEDKKRTKKKEHLNLKTFSFSGKTLSVSKSGIKKRSVDEKDDRMKRSHHKKKIKWQRKKKNKSRHRKKNKSRPNAYSKSHHKKKKKSHYKKKKKSHYKKKKKSHHKPHRLSSRRRHRIKARHKKKKLTEAEKRGWKGYSSKKSQSDHCVNNPCREGARCINKKHGFRHD